MRRILSITKKELDKIFLDKRLIFTTFILPGLIIFLVYTSMGKITANNQFDVINHTSVIYYTGDNSPLLPFLEAEQFKNIEFKKAENKLDEEAIKQEIHNGTIDLWLDIESFDTITKKINVTCYNDSSVENSRMAKTRITLLLEAYQTSIIISEVGDIQKYGMNSIEFADESFESTSILSMIVPMMLVIMLFANSMSISAESIAGEKERGTLATLIMTPIKRTDIIIAKVLSNTIISLLAGLSSFIGMLLSMDNIADTIGISTNLNYGFSDYILLLLIIFTIAIIAVSLFSIASTIAKTVKEASSLSLPMYLIGMTAAIVSSNSSVPQEWQYYLIPVYNCACCLKALLEFSLNPWNMIITMLSSIAFFGIICYILSRLFKKENILFGH